MSMKKNWTLYAPDWSRLDEIWKNPNPFSLWPIGNQPLVDHWMDAAVEQGIDEVIIHTADRPSELRNHLRGGVYWSIDVSIVSIQSDDKAPLEAIPIIGLPKSNRSEISIDSPHKLLLHWIDLNRSWLNQLSDYNERIEVKHPSGGWIGPKTRIHPSATFEKPFWIQGKCEIGPKAHIGARVCIGENSIIDENASVQRSIVLPDTLVGKNVSLDQVAADGGLLLDAKHGCRVPITDAFILSDIGKDLNTPDFLERVSAIFLFLLIAPIVGLSRIDWSRIVVHDGAGGAIELKTGNKGPLITRRWHWLKEVIKGRMRLIGILPRSLDWSAEADEEVATRLKNTRPGVFSLSDLHDCHCCEESDEWIHASYQALGPDEEAAKLVKNNLLKLALKRAI